MEVSASAWLVIILAIIAANLPFFNDRLFGIIPLSSWLAKPFWLRLLELTTFYFSLGFIASLLESTAGNRFPQTWEFYAITSCLFIVLAFPGFVYRYLRKQHG
ncbi:DUF2818 family protein [Undibacterium sp. RuTC16W]|uniref:DUF2818 family protein n=1 Tax=Undibacterium sp. RuTC16W TaxID=3413048 RepID=UPI003BF19476